MGCVMTPEYAFLVNGRPRGRVIPSRGLQQGCPVSPYLILFCVEALSSLISQAESQFELMGLSEFIAPNGEWDVGKSQMTFLPMDADAILSIPLASGVYGDKWCWHFDRDDIYSIKSDYSLAWSLQFDEGVADLSRLVR
uniref:Reverse transcriptase domain-containing protein n=1 Tax=Cannabis sativa TaxID=3483 RepID=A0A803NJ19_CANSA